MTVVDATAIVGALAALVGIFLQGYWSRRKKRKEENADNNVSWVGLNNAIAKERDNWKAEAETKDAELEAQKTAHAAEILSIQQRHDQENAEWARKLGECQAKVQALYRELYELQRLLPPNLRPGPDNGVG